MSVKDVKNVRGGKPFRPADIIVYVALAAVIVALLLAFVFLRDDAEAAEIYADCGDERVFSYSFSAGRLTVSDAFADRVDTEEEDGALVVTFWADEERTHYNEIVIGDGEAYVRDPNCSARPDCVHMAAITDSGGIIVCVPHELKLYASGNLGPSLG